MAVAAVLPRETQEKPSRASAFGLRILVLLVLIGVWELIQKGLPSTVLASPQSVVSAIGSLARSGALWQDVAPSIIDMAIGFAIVSVTGTLIGLLIGSSRRLRQGFVPIIYLFNSMPTVALLPLIAIWAGVGLTARIVFIVIVSEWALILNTIQGVAAIDSGTSEVARAYRLRGRNRFCHVLLPGTLPYVFVGLRIAMSHVVIGMIIAGQELGDNGLGGAANSYGTYFQTADVIVVVVASTALALLSFAAIRKARDLAAPWIAEMSRG